MPRVNYATVSPYYTTDQSSFFLLYFNYREIPAHSTDVVYKIEGKYQYRPDLLAYDVYGDSRLWWVFTNANMNSIKDPIWDFKAGLTITYPTKDRLSNFIR